MASQEELARLISGLTANDYWMLEQAVDRELRDNRSLRKSDRRRLTEIKETILAPAVEAGCPVTIVAGEPRCPGSR